MARFARSEGFQELLAGLGHFGYGTLEDFGVGLGRFVKAADFADELQGGGVEFFGCGRLARLAEHLYASAHFYIIAQEVGGLDSRFTQAGGRL